MLVQFTVGNYRSFADPVTLSMIASRLKSKNPSVDENNVAPLKGRNYSMLPVALIYGANASGKSNLLQALDALHGMVLNSARDGQAGDLLPVEPHLLRQDLIDQPSTFELVFIIDDVEYIYNLSASNQSVVSERLAMRLTSKETLLFHRNGTDVEYRHGFRKLSRVGLMPRDNALILSLGIQLNIPEAAPILKWFKMFNILDATEGHRFLGFTLGQVNGGSLQSAITELLINADTGIEGIDVKKVPIDVESTKNASEDLKAQLKLLGLKNQLEILTNHSVFDEQNVKIGDKNFELNSHESLGTQRLFALAGPLIDTLNNGKVLVIDELDSSLHPNLTTVIVRLFANKTTNPNGAQLIATTHDTGLMDPNLIRRDQIWFIEKSVQGRSKLYSLAEIKVRNDAEYSENYLRGKYGGTPILNIQSMVSG